MGMDYTCPCPSTPSNPQKCKLISRHTLLVENGPHFPRCDRNIDVSHTEVGQGIDNGIGNGLWRTDGRRFTDTLCADGMVRRRCDRLIGLPMGSLHRRRYQVVHEVAALDIAFIVKGDLLV